MKKRTEKTSIMMPEGILLNLCDVPDCLYYINRLEETREIKRAELVVIEKERDSAKTEYLFALTELAAFRGLAKGELADVEDKKDALIADIVRRLRDVREETRGWSACAALGTYEDEIEKLIGDLTKEASNG